MKKKSCTGLPGKKPGKLGEPTAKNTSASLSMRTTKGGGKKK